MNGPLNFFPGPSWKRTLAVIETGRTEVPSTSKNRGRKLRSPVPDKGGGELGGECSAAVEFPHVAGKAPVGSDIQIVTGQLAVFLQFEPHRVDDGEGCGEGQAE